MIRFFTMAILLCGLISFAGNETKTGKAFFDTAESFCMKRNYGEALNYYRLAADQQYFPAYRSLASLHHSGRLGSYNYDDAVKWLEKANAQGDIGAVGRLGLHYLQGRGVERDEVKGREMLEKAAKKGDAFSQYFMGMLTYDFNDSEPNKWFRLAAAQGNADAQYEIGTYLLRTKSYAEAFKWFEKAAFQNHHNAQKELSKCYLNGEGTQKNLMEACAWAFISNGWSGSDLSVELPPNERSQAAQRISELKNEIEQSRVKNWKKSCSVHY